MWNEGKVKLKPDANQECLIKKHIRHGHVRAGNHKISQLSMNWVECSLWVWQCKVKQSHEMFLEKKKTSLFRLIGQGLVRKMSCSEMNRLWIGLFWSTWRSKSEYKNEIFRTKNVCTDYSIATRDWESGKIEVIDDGTSRYNLV